MFTILVQTKCVSNNWKKNFPEILLDFRIISLHFVLLHCEISIVRPTPWIVQKCVLQMPYE